MQNLSWGRRLAFSLCLVVVASNVLSPVTASAQQTRRAASASASGKKVRLIVGIVIDQFRYDYLTRFEDQFGEGGFKRLLNGFQLLFYLRILRKHLFHHQFFFGSASIKCVHF